MKLTKFYEMTKKEPNMIHTVKEDSEVLTVVNEDLISVDKVDFEDLMVSICEIYLEVCLVVVLDDKVHKDHSLEKIFKLV
jgi:hypothetical protein